MDQLSLSDVENSVGIGGFKYGIVYCKVEEDYWNFVPLRTLLAGEADKSFRQFCNSVGLTSDVILVHCDAHTALVRICDNFGASRKHPPPGCPVGNAVIERKVGLVLQGIRAYLSSAGLPNCFLAHGWSCVFGELQFKSPQQKQPVTV